MLINFTTEFNCFVVFSLHLFKKYISKMWKHLLSNLNSFYLRENHLEWTQKNIVFWISALLENGLFREFMKTRLGIFEAARSIVMQIRDFVLFVIWLKNLSEFYLNCFKSVTQTISLTVLSNTYLVYIFLEFSNSFRTDYEKEKSCVEHGLGKI